MYAVTLRLRITIYIVFFAIFMAASFSGGMIFHKWQQDQKRTEKRALVSSTKASYFEKIQSSPDIIFFGDSLTENGQFSEHFPQYIVANRGISGDTTAGALQRISEIARRRPSKIFVMFGVNDVSRDVPLQSTQKNYKTILERLKSTKAEIYIQSTLLTRRPSLNTEIRSLNSFLRQEAETAPLMTFIDLNAALSEDGQLQSQNTYDGIHLTGEGYNKWVEVLTPFIGNNKERY